MKTTLKILHLEDLASDAALVERELDKAERSYEKLVVDTGQKFLQALTEFKPDIILSDHSLPSFNSIEALKIIKEAGLKIPFILVTSTVSEEFAVTILKMGANDYILKDNMSRLNSAIQHVFEKYEDRAAKRKAEEALRKTNERLLFHLENSPLAYIEWDDQLQVTSWSKHAEEIFGWTMKECINGKLKAYDLIYDGDEQVLVTAVAQKLLSGTDERNSVINRNYRKDGTVIWCEWFNSVLKDEQGNVKTIMSLVQDITERKQAEAMLAKNQLRIREFFETAPEALFVLDPVSGVIVDYNDNALKLLNCKAEQLKGKLPISFCPEYQPNGIKTTDFLKEKDHTVSAGKHPVFDLVIQDVKGKTIPCEVRLNILNNHEPPQIRASLLDITRRVTLERKLIEEKTRSQVEVTDAILFAQEQERAFLGQELHDNINQLLATSKLYLDFSVTSDDNRKDMLQTARNYILSAMEEIRKLSKTLIAPSLGEMTLHEALLDLVKNIQQVRNISFQCDCILTDEHKISDKFRLSIFRIFQEQLNNVLKHSRAKTVWIKLKQNRNSIQLSIKDDGIGFDTGIKRNGVGIKNILSRASLFNGTVNVVSAPGLGTELNVHFSDIFNQDPKELPVVNEKLQEVKRLG
ncbi:MAG: PAS domain S-box protein [Bacteroidetes bacterium]|nr:PAS domain S-box protein [Bacteroidota bacterium]